MGKPTKILLGGIVCAGIIASGQLFYNRWLENQLRASEAECIAEGKRDLREGSHLLCDADSLSEDAVGVQAKLYSAGRELRVAKLNPLFFYFAVLVIVLCALPWLWYFLLRRIRELRDVIAGK
jgi:hypothetical protein